MQIKIFNQEKLDNLEDKIMSAKASFECLLTKNENPTQATLKSIASLGSTKNIDLYYLQSILASVGPNKNDDVFLAPEIWAARHTPIHKQLNYMHDEKDIIGVITDSIVLDSVGQPILDDSQIDLISDIATEAVIWTIWDDPDKASRIRAIIDSIEKNELFVSMEAIFRQFDYMIVRADGSSSIVPRTEQTSFLTKYLRSFGGQGVWDNSKIYRVLRNFTFSGKGIVFSPANSRSIINDNLFLSNNQLATKAEYIMEEELKSQIAELQSALAKANEEVGSLKTKASMELEDLKTQAAALKTLAAETKAKMDEMEDECESKLKDMEKQCAEKISSIQAELDTAKAKLSEVEAQKVEAERISKLVASNLDAEKAKEIVKTFASLNDELFDQVVSLYGVRPDKSTASSPNTSVEDAIKSTASSNDSVGDQIKNIEQLDSDLTSLSKSIASKLSFTKKTKKGDK